MCNFVINLGAYYYPTGFSGSFLSKPYGYGTAHVQPMPNPIFPYAVNVYGWIGDVPTPTFPPNLNSGGWTPWYGSQIGSGDGIPTWAGTGMNQFSVSFNKPPGTRRNDPTGYIWVVTSCQVDMQSFAVFGY
jgi:hypothetical protein